VIITRAPLRITLGGGGTDIPAYYSKHGGRCLAAAIDKYVYITIHETFVDDLIVKYSKLERVPDAEHVEHPIVREALLMLGIRGRGLEICSHADIPAGTGLGSSSAFTVALLSALHAYRHQVRSPQEIAEEACRIEIDALEQPIGKQDQYIAAYGGLTIMSFDKDGQVFATGLNLRTDTFADLEDNLLLFFTGYTRRAAEILGTTSMPDDVSASWVAGNAADALESGDIQGFAKMLNEQWLAKNKRTEATKDIQQWHTLAMYSGALGGKLVGAGGGGFLLFYAEDRASLRRAMCQAGLREVRFRIDFDGARVVAS
jgi:D-glycero-alpha-D-manno-heptose-7-phosphate kinase